MHIKVKELPVILQNALEGIKYFKTDIEVKLLVYLMLVVKVIKVFQLSLTWKRVKLFGIMEVGAALTCLTLITALT